MPEQETTEVYHPVHDAATLGRGTFGDVRLVKRERDGRLLACKRIGFGKQTKEETKREVNFIARLDHPNIVRYFDVKWGPLEGRIYTEFCNENLESYTIKKKSESSAWPSEPEVLSVVYQLSAALAYCHHGIIRTESGRILQERVDIHGAKWKPVLHRDIKPANVLAQYTRSGHLIVKLADFGLAHTVQSSEETGPRSFVGTMPYIAPEVTKHRPNWSTKSDIFSLRCTLYYFVMRKTPFDDQLDQSYRGSLSKIPDHFSEDLWITISNCIDYDASNRKDAGTMFLKAATNVEPHILLLGSMQSLDNTSASPSQVSRLTHPDEGYGTRTSSSLQVQHHADGSLQSTEPTHSGSVNSAPVHAEVSEISQGCAVEQGPASAPPVPRETVGLQTVELGNPAQPSLRLRPSQISSQAGSSIPHSQVVPQYQQSSSLSAPSWDPLGHSRGTNGINMVELLGGMGSFVVNYNRHPPTDDIKLPSLEYRRKIHEIPTGPVSLQVGDVKAPSSSVLNMGASRQESQVMVSLEARSSREFVLTEQSEYFAMAATEDGVWGWISRRKDEGQRVHLVVGFITYMDARVATSREGYGSKFGASIEVGPSMELGPSIGVGSTSGRSLSTRGADRSFEKPGFHVQAVDLREVITVKRSVFNRVMGRSRENPSWTLGPLSTTFFWGPKERPDSPE